MEVVVADRYCVLIPKPAWTGRTVVALLEGSSVEAEEALANSL